MAPTLVTGERLTQYALGGGCACKIPPGDLERLAQSEVAAPVAARSALDGLAAEVRDRGGLGGPRT